MKSDAEKKIAALKKEYKTVSMDKKQIQSYMGKIREAKEKEIHINLMRKAAAGIAAVLFFICLILPNLSGKVASAMKEIPVIGHFFELITIREYRYEDETQSAEVEISKLEISKKETPKKDSVKEKELKKSAEEINREIKALSESWIKKFKSQMKKKGYQGIKIYSELLNRTKKFFTLKMTCQQTQADSYEENYYYTIDLNTGQRLQLKDLFKEGSDYITPISESIKQQMRTQMQSDDGVSYWIDDKDFPDDNFQSIRPNTGFYMNEENELTIAFKEGDVAPMYMGAVEFVIPDDVIKDIRVE